MVLKKLVYNPLFIKYVDMKLNEKKSIKWNYMTKWIKIKWNERIKRHDKENNMKKLNGMK